jgi:hypothetical protein
MLRKVLFGALTLLLALGMIGCGGKKDDANDKKDTAVAVEGSADKAVLAYAQLYAYGNIEDENKAAAGMADADIEKVQEQVIAPIIDSFKMYPLSDESVKTMATQYVEKLHAVMNMKATIKTEDKEHPVVTLTVTTIDGAGAAKIAENNADLIALGTAYGELQAQGLTEEQLKESPEFQQFAIESINNFINEFPLNPEASMDFTCDIVKGADGKMHWAPQDPAAVAKFVTGQK